VATSYCWSHTGTSANVSRRCACALSIRRHHKTGMVTTTAKKWMYVVDRVRVITQTNNNNKKPELMLMRRARAYSSSCSQVILVNFYPFRRNALLAAKNRQKITRNQYFYCSRSFKIIDVNISKTFVASACYHKQHVSAVCISATIFTLDKPTTDK